MSGKVKIFIVLCFLIFAQSVFTQVTDSIFRKKINISKVTESPRIDGVLDDIAWKNAAIAANFVERTPVNGRPEPDHLKTEVKIVYDNLGIYFGATMYDPEPHKIPREFTERDQIGNHDFFFISLNGYNDNQQSFQFAVTTAGVQFDAKMINDKEDTSWNAVWYSAVSINHDSWVAEIFIPYSELRFPDNNVHVWGLNMEREFRRERTRYSWNHIDNTRGGFLIYDGEIHGIENIETPIRLSLQPYLSTYVNSYDGKSELVFNGGLDLKYGINDAFTLDMVLIPDFGQTRFDETVLNLSAFEVQYTEQRPFFTEGTELFSKGGLFYSRRVGGSPTGFPTLEESEEIKTYPSRIDLLNAVKISGRTSGGLGIGFFNAITKKTYATIENTETETTRRELVEPLANYNVLVLDQRFGQNNSVTLVNTNVFREGNFRDANATALLLDLTNKSNTFRYYSYIKNSWVMTDNTKYGAAGRALISNISGKHRYTGSVNFRTQDYDINDLGFTTNTNFISYYGYYGYRTLQPTENFNSIFFNLNLNLNRRLDPDLYYAYNLNMTSSFTTRDFLSFGAGFEATPFGINDIYEPRENGRHVAQPAYYNPWAWMSTDYRKKFAFDINLNWMKFDELNRETATLRISPRFRFSDRFSLFASGSFSTSKIEQGFVNRIENEIIFGQRDRNTTITSLESRYIFNEKMALNLLFRHYMSEVTYHQFYTLEMNGDLSPNSVYQTNHDTTFNSWNLDLKYTWWFAPGSQITFLYRNAIDSFFDRSGINYGDNLTYLFDRPQFHSFSVRISYFLDYNRTLGKIFERNEPSPSMQNNTQPHINLGRH